MAEQLRGGVCLHGLEVAGAYHAGKKIGLGKAGSLLLPALGSTLEISLWKAEAWEIRKHTVSMVFTDGTSVDILDLPAIDRKYLYQWLHFTTSWAVPENTTSAALRIRNTAYGYGRFDDISVRQII